MGKYNNLYRERAARIIEVPYYSVSLQCLQIFSKKVMGFTYNIYNISLKEYGDFPVNYTALFYECCRKNPIYIANILRGSLCYLGKIFNWYGENL